MDLALVIGENGISGPSEIKWSLNLITVSQMSNLTIFPTSGKESCTAARVILLVVLTFHIFWKGSEIFNVEGKNDRFSNFLPNIIWRKYYSPPPSLLFNFSICVSNTNGCRYGCFKNRHVDIYEVQKYLAALYDRFLLGLELHQQVCYWQTDSPGKGLL